MKTADEMLSELGYMHMIETIDNTVWILYGHNYKYEIDFNKKRKEVAYRVIERETDTIVDINGMSIKELQAINKKVEELRVDKIIRKVFLKKDNKLNQYPCNVYLQNALRFIVDKEYDEAYSEICWAIIKSGGKLTEEQEKIFKDINRRYFK